MDTKLRIVKRLPLEGLWDENGQDLNLHAARELGGDDIRDLIRGGRPVPFVVVAYLRLDVSSDRLNDSMLLHRGQYLGRR